jgi:hypothetical protein
MRFFLIRVILLYRLGFLNVARNLSYKIKLRFGFFKKKPLNNVKRACGSTLFLADDKKPVTLINKNLIPKQFEHDIKGLVSGNVKLFFWEKVSVSNPPDWFFHHYKKYRCHWSEVKLNGVPGEDIKLTWDLSRLHWMQQLACAYKSYGNDKYLLLLNDWFVVWRQANPVDSGVNWSCGQECAIRIIHVLNTSKILQHVPHDEALLTLFVKHHVERIMPTIGYAISQDNNHGITEAAALFICGAWLLKNSKLPKSYSKKILLVGQKTLESRVEKLIMDDGGFSMYSTNYHRVVLNTLGIVEMWRKELSVPAFSDQYMRKCQSAIRWLYLLVDEQTGDTMNLGTNDGSNPFVVQSSDYRDYRPSIQFASVIFSNQKVYEDSRSTNEPLLWLNLNAKLPIVKPCGLESQSLTDSGIVALFGTDVGSPGTNVFIKYPNYTFRPGQSDALHVDLWHKGQNILRDGGSYSYNGTLNEGKFFSSLQAHNTVQIDSIEPMPKLGPFLRSNWSKMDFVGDVENNKNTLSWVGKYSVKKGINHQRQVRLSNNICKVTDEVTGASDTIILRWRLSPESWRLKGNILSGKGIRIKVSSEKSMDVQLKQGYESRYYNQYEEVPVLEVSVNSPSACIITSIYLEN